MALRLLPLAFLALSCQGGYPPDYPERIDSALHGAVSSFEREFAVSIHTQVRIRDLSHFDDVTGYPAFGRCAIFSSPRFVEIDPRVLGHGGAFTEFVVYHELGHCVFGLPHVNEPYSIMREGYDPAWAGDYARNRARFIEHFRELIEGRYH